MGHRHAGRAVIEQEFDLEFLNDELVGLYETLSR